MDLDDRGESDQEDLAELRIASQVAADKRGEFSSASTMRDHTAFGQHLLEVYRAVDRCDERAVAHKVRIALRKDDDIAGFKGYRPAIFFDANVASSFGDQVKDNDVLRTGGEIRCQRACIGLACAPRR